MDQLWNYADKIAYDQFRGNLELWDGFVIGTGPRDLLVFFTSRKIIWFHLSTMAYLMRPNARYCFSINNNLKKFIDVWEGFCGFLGHRKEVIEPMYPILCLLEDAYLTRCPSRKKILFIDLAWRIQRVEKTSFWGESDFIVKCQILVFWVELLDNDGASDECLEIHKHKAMSSKGNLFYPFFVEDVVVCSS